MPAPSDLVIGARRIMAPPRAGLETDSVPITADFLANELSKLTTSLHLSLNSSITLSVTQSVTEALKENIKVLADRIQGIEFDVNTIVEKQVIYEKQVDDRFKALEAASLYSLIEQNKMQQRLRDKTVKIHNFISPTPVSLELLSEAYDLLVRPCFVKALDTGRIKAVPHMMDVLEFGHRLRPRPGGDPASILMVFSTRFWHSIFNDFYKETLAEILAPNKAAPAGGTNAPGIPAALAHPKFRIGRDLTQIFRACMSNLYARDNVDKVKLSGGKVSFTLMGSTAWRVVHNPISADLNIMQTPVARPSALENVLIAEFAE